MSVQIDYATENDDEGIRSLMRVPVRGLIDVSMTREPNISMARSIEGIRDTTIVVKDERAEVIGVGARSVRQAYVNGQLGNLGYLHQFRVEGNRLSYQKLVNGYELLAARRQTDELAYDITTIIEDNTRARRLLEKGLTGLPLYREEARLHTFVISTHAHGKDSPSRVAPAQRHQETEIQALLSRYQRSKHYASPWLSNNGLYPEIEEFVIALDHDRLVGCCAVWDQRKFKQIVINQYQPILKTTRRLLNSVLRLRRQPTLPKAPCELDLAYLSFFAYDSDDKGLMIYMLQKACLEAAKKGIKYLALTLTDNDSNYSLIKRCFSPFIYKSILYTVHWDKHTLNNDSGDVDIALEGALL